MSRKVIIDTNGLMIPGQFGVDIFSELDRLGFNYYAVPRSVVNELENIKTRGKGNDKKAAKIAISLLDRCKIIEKEGYADDVISDIATLENMAVLTNDIKLKKELCSKGVTIVYLREKTRLSI